MTGVNPTCPSLKRIMMDDERMPAAKVLCLIYRALEALFTLKCLTIL
jgi:hypothetical protein